LIAQCAENNAQISVMTQDLSVLDEE
jgi:hypothetical protein